MWFVVFWFLGWTPPATEQVILTRFTSDSWVCVRYESNPPSRDANLSCAKATDIRDYILKNAAEYAP